MKRHGCPRGRKRNTQWAATFAVASVMALTGLGVGGGVAVAAPTAQVKASTQRMSDATLKSTQTGTYAQGRTLALTCFKRGQAVKGYFSKYIAGGYDNLWYQTSDGGFVADVDIETGSNSPVTPQCGGGGTPAPAPSPASSKAARAVAWANSAVGSNAYNFLCGQFVANAYGKSALGYGTALQFYSALRNAGQIHTGGVAPAGALVFSRSSADQGAGHVDIARGDGKFVSGGVSTAYGTGRTVQILSSANPSRGATYLGWAYAPASWPGR